MQQELLHASLSERKSIVAHKRFESLRGKIDMYSINKEAR